MDTISTKLHIILGVSGKMKAFLALSIIAFLAGCSATGPKYGEVAPAFPSLDPSKVRMTFLREPKLLYVALDARVEVDGGRVGSLASGAFTYIDQEPGQTVVTVDNWSFPGRYVISVNLSAGEEYFFEIFPRSESYMPGILGGMIGLAIDASVNENSGAFKVVPISKEAAEQKLLSLNFTH